MTFRGQPFPDGGSPTILLEQQLGSMPLGMEVDEAVKTEEDVNGYPAIVWESQNLDGRTVIIADWEDPNKGMWVNLVGLLSKDEAIRVLESLR